MLTSSYSVQTTATFMAAGLKVKVTIRDYKYYVWLYPQLIEDCRVILSEIYCKFEMI